MSKIAVYAGTFDPVTNGHTDIIERAVKVFDRLVVAVAESTPKTTLFSANERKELILEAMPELLDRIEVRTFKGLLVDFVREIGATVIVRGLRAVSDYEYEAQMAIINRQLAPTTETVFLMTSRRSSFISSSVVRQIAEHNGDLSSLVPPNVAAKLKDKFKR